MNCKNCGAFLPDGAEKCAYCGCDPKKGKTGKKKATIIIIAAVAVIAVAAAAVCLALFTRSGGLGADTPEQAVETAMSSLLSGDIRTTLDMIPDCMLNDFSKYWNEGGEYKDRDSIAQAYSYSDARIRVRSLKGRFGVCLGKNVYPKHMEEEFAEQLGELERRYAAKGLDAGKIEEINTVAYSYTITVANNEKEITDEVTCVKFEGRWYVLYDS
ncbi:MAG: hypothetical protein J6W93_04075 [Clostridia bacterium]|nr:hypothetical protein [Clostridia bacterium]